jgi:hypothetical protein
MVSDFLAHMRTVPDHRIPGMVTYSLDEILLTTLVGVVCRADDWDDVEDRQDRQLSDRRVVERGQ